MIHWRERRNRLPPNWRPGTDRAGAAQRRGRPAVGKTEGGAIAENGCTIERLAPPTGKKPLVGGPSRRHSSIADLVTLRGRKVIAVLAGTSNVAIRPLGWADDQVLLGRHVVTRSRIATHREDLEDLRATTSNPDNSLT